jgi:hypothetical protein
MKYYLHILLLLASANFYANNLENCGLDNNPALTDDEAAFLNTYFGEDTDGFDFKGKKILIVTGAEGSRFETKAEYFRDIKQRLQESGLPVATTPYPLTEMEKIQSGGYDAVITHWVNEPISKEKRRNIIARLASGIWETFNN